MRIAWRAIKEMGGQPLPACGFGLGLERLLLLMEAQDTKFPEPKKCDLYIASMGENANIKAAAIAKELRSEGMCVQFDTVGRGLKAQMKYANKIGALYTLVLGDNEIETGNIKIKNMETGNESEMELADFAENFQAKVIADAMSEFESLGMEGFDLSTLLGGVE